MCLAAALALATMGASTALAHEPGELTGKWRVFKACPLHNAEMQAAIKEHENKRFGESFTSAVCLLGKTEGGPTGGYFSLGRIVVPLIKPVILQVGGIVHCVEEFGRDEGCGPAANEGDPETAVVAPENGEAGLVSPELPVPGGIKQLSESVQNSAKWPAALKASWKEAIKNKEVAIKAKIEIAGGNRLYEEEDAVSGNRLIEANGTAFELPLKVKLTGPWLTKLGGGPCLIGTDEHPVVQHLSTGKSGNLTGEIGEIHFFESFTITEVAHNTLVDNTWPVEVPAQGCGGSEYESFVDSAISKVLGIPSPAGAGQTILTGTLYQGNGEQALIDSETGKP